MLEQLCVIVHCAYEVSIQPCLLFGRLLKAKEDDNKSVSDLRDIGVQLSLIKYVMKKKISEKKNLDPPVVPVDMSALDIAMLEELDFASLQEKEARLEKSKTRLEESKARLEESKARHEEMELLSMSESSLALECICISVSYFFRSTNLAPFYMMKL